ncbi:hypothetical protein EMEDMD4_220032 [Sinorhizobium medicae]|uniref:Uncharacterized protein n=1 Tax=Sinorhizobium medicae TaxID=110321 RepID=A0A508WU69_9HYPH|nr:hypothetical protein EMEDMD4_220032 [Sinorhizobium medicae]
MLPAAGNCRGPDQVVRAGPDFTRNKPAAAPFRSIGWVRFFAFHREENGGRPPRADTISLLRSIRCWSCG